MTRSERRQTRCQLNQPSGCFGGGRGGGVDSIRSSQNSFHTTGKKRLTEIRGGGGGGRRKDSTKLGIRKIVKSANKPERALQESRILYK